MARGGRPKQDTDTLRGRYVSVRLTDLERAQLEQRATATGFASVSDFVRATALTNTMRARRSAVPVFSAEDRAAFNALAMEERAIGVNLNQVARTLNAGMDRPIMADLADALAGHAAIRQAGRHARQVPCMNPVSISRGHSFKGATAYAMGMGQETERAEWSSVENIGTDNAYMAARFMAATAMDAGRKQPKGAVWHGMVSWDEQTHPDAAHQKACVQGLLKSMGLDRAQAVLVGHSANDNGKTHVHIIVNLIDPATGRIWADHRNPDNKTKNCLSDEKRKMQAFALAYCEAMGIESSPNRKKNAEARETARAADHARAEAEKTAGHKVENAKTEQTKAAETSKMEGTKRLSRAEWQAMKDELFARQAAERAELATKHGADWQAAKSAMAAAERQAAAQWRTAHEQQKRAAKDENRPFWRETFKRQKAEAAVSQERIDRAIAQERAARGLLRRALSSVGIGPRVDQVQAGLAVAQMQHAALLAYHETQRKAAAIEQGRTVFERTKAAAPPAPRVDLSSIKERHNQEWAQTRERQAADRAAAGIRSNPEKARDQENRRDDRPRDRDRERPIDPQQGRDEPQRREHIDSKDKGSAAPDLSAEQRARYERMRERERQERERDRGHER